MVLVTRSRFSRAQESVMGNFGVRNINICAEKGPVYEVISKRQKD